MDSQTILEKLRQVADKDHASGMAHFGINTTQALGVRVPELRKLAKEIKKNHALALDLWQTGIHEARILASMIADPKQMTADLMDQWTADFNSWDLCDQCCSNVYVKTPFVEEKIRAWVNREEEFVKRAGFSLIAYAAVHLKKAEDSVFIAYFPLIKAAATDDRNYVKKAVNWALRGIGKRNEALRLAAIQTAHEIVQIESKAAQWIAKDALRELEKERH